MLASRQQHWMIGIGGLEAGFGRGRLALRQASLLIQHELGFARANLQTVTYYY
jgi:hypothetical protein